MKATTGQAVNYFEELEALRLAYPDLTYDNHGYDNIDKDVFEANSEGVKSIEVLLKAAVKGFVRFQNFKPRKDGTFAVRCQTKWNERFVGVSYFPMENFTPGHPSWEDEEQT